VSLKIKNFDTAQDVGDLKGAILSEIKAENLQTELAPGKILKKSAAASSFVLKFNFKNLDMDESNEWVKFTTNFGDYELHGLANNVRLDGMKNSSTARPYKTLLDNCLNFEDIVPLLCEIPDSAFGKQIISFVPFLLK